MARTILDNGTWFDKEKADLYEEDTNWNGQNRISVNTGSQWNHEELYRTSKKVWVLCYWSQWSGAKAPSYNEISTEEAVKWLVRNGHKVPSDCVKEMESLEV